jgi:hypothetical protein
MKKSSCGSKMTTILKKVAKPMVEKKTMYNKKTKK